MNRYAIILDGVVANISLWDGTTPWNPGSQYILIDVSSIVPSVGIDWTYDGTNFHPPIIPPPDPATSPNVATINVSPVAGGTVAFLPMCDDQLMYITPLTPITGLTIELPPEESSCIGQLLRIATTMAITTLNMTGGSIANPITDLFTGGMASFQKMDVNSWMRLQ